jgi:DNA-binding beta-propeller fold protein YncE
MRRRLFSGCLGCGLLLLLLVAAVAPANRVPLTSTAVHTTFCKKGCPLPSEAEALFPVPPKEGEIEGPCGLAVSGNSLYVSDYYHRAIDTFSLSGPFPANYISLLSLPGTNPVSGPVTLDGVCGLAADSTGNLYGNEMHEGVLRLAPTLETIDTGNSTGVAVDGGGNLYVDYGTYVAEYEAPIAPGDEPDKKIGPDHLLDAFGLAVFGGRVYVPDAADDTVKVFEPALKLDEPVLALSPPEGFGSLADAAVAVDPTNGHLLVVSSAQFGLDHPVATIYEFDSSGSFLGRLPGDPVFGNPVFGEPSGIAVDPATGNLFVTDGNSELSNVFAYGPYAEAGSGGAERTGPADLPAASTAAARAASVASPSSPGAGGDFVASTSTVVRRGPVQVSFDGRLTPHALPRHGTAPVGIEVEAKISGTQGNPPPQLRKLAIAINRYGRLTSSGLPLCNMRAIQPSTNSGALAACGDSLVGEGHFSANVKLPQQSPFPSSGKVLAFNGRLHGKPAILAHIYGTEPAPTSYVLPFLIRVSQGTYGSVLEASLPQATGNWGYVTGLRMNLHRRFSYRGRGRSYLSAGCPAPAGFPGAVFPLARTSFSFAGGPNLVSVLNRSCRVTR